MPLPSLDETHHLKYARVVGKSLASDFQFGQRAFIISITSIDMHRLCEVRFARIRLQTKSGIDRVLRHGQPRGGMVDLLNRAVARDPSFLDAYCQMAFAHDQ